MAIATSNSVTTPVVTSSNSTLTDEFINGLVQGGSWVFSGPRTLTYSFNLNDNGAYPEFPELVGPGPGGPWSASPQVAAAVVQALSAWEAVANVTFQQVTSGNYYYESNADLSFTLTGNDLQTAFGAAALGLFPDPAYANALLAEIGYTSAAFPNMEGNVFLDNYGTPLASSVASGSQGFWTILHEIGHALGLKHTFDDGGNLRPTFSALGISDFDVMKYTVMSYTVGFAYAATPMPLDILAIQTIYGPNTTYHTGDDTYALNNGYFGTIWDAGGTDVIDATSWMGSAGVLIDLTAGSYSGGRESEKFTAIAYSVAIENAIGSGEDDSLIGNTLANSLSGSGGNDSLDGGLGADTLSGGQGNDFYLVDQAGDIIIENVAAGFDLVRSSVDFVLPANVEKLTLTGTAVYATGNALDNVLTGNVTANVLDGGLGFDVMIGGQGNDVYRVDTKLAPYSIVMGGPTGEYISGGQSYFFTDATGTFSVSGLWDRTGDALIDFVRIYYFDFNFANWWTLEFGTDGLGQNLAPGTYLNAERATFATAGHPGLDVSGNGRGSNGVDGSFTINAVDIDYSGGSPVLSRFSASFEQHSDSSLLALTGSINYNYDSGIIETIIENPDEGFDTVLSLVSANLPDNVEKMVLAGTEHLNGTGNSISNILSGNAGNNRLDGAGGADIIAGGTGNDTYVLDNSGDQVMELVDAGTDVIQSAVSYNLMQAWHVENLTLIGGGAINGSGNWLGNVITGNAAANRIDGNQGNDTLMGGGGADTLIGGAGDDTLSWHAGIASVQGGAGADTLRIDGTGVTLDLTLVADSVISDVEVINMTGSGNNLLKLAFADVLVISSATDILKIDGDAGDTVQLQGAWINTGGTSYISYVQGLATVLIDSDITAVLV